MLDYYKSKGLVYNYNILNTDQSLNGCIRDLGFK